MEIYFFHKFIQPKAQALSLLCLCSVLAFAVSVPAAAQSNDIINRLKRIENEMETLSRAVYRGENPPPSGASAADPLAQDSIEQRIQQLEQDLRTLTGTIERQSYDIQQVQVRLDSLDAAMQASSAVPAPALPAAQPQASYTPAQPVQVFPEQPQPLQSGDVFPSPAAGGGVETGAGEVAGAQTASLPALGSDPAAHYEEAFSILKNGNYDQAEQSFQSFLTNYPDHSLAGNAMYWLGETYYVRNRYEDAAKVFAQSYQKYPASAKGPDTLLKLGLSLSGMGKNAEACIALKQLGSAYPDAQAPVTRRAEQEAARLQCAL